jgi:hypothetical protein
MRVRLLALLAACLAATRPAAAAATEGVPAFGHVSLVIGENTTYSHLKPSNAPYLLGTIRPRAAWLTSYYAATHWPQANYVAMVTGSQGPCGAWGQRRRYAQGRVPRVSCTPEPSVPGATLAP